MRHAVEHDTAAPEDEPPGTWPSARFQAPFGVP